MLGKIVTTGDINGIINNSKNKTGVIKMKNKKQIRQEKLQAHYKSLEKLAKKCGVKNPDGKKISVKLLKLENRTHKATEQSCNGEIPEIEFDIIEKNVMFEIDNIFNNNLKGFFVNGDPRGYALKIDDEVFKNEYSDCGLERDWGGYGLLSPSID